MISYSFHPYIIYLHINVHKCLTIAIIHKVSVRVDPKSSLTQSNDSFISVSFSFINRSVEVKQYFR